MRQGFTLIELSIVLVIIGLVVGGVLVGRDMIRAAEIRGVYKGYEEIVTAANTFRTKYNCLPGDCGHATDFFGTHPSCPDLSTATPLLPAIWENDTPTLLTCNGDGDRRIDANATIYEMTSLWQHLANASLIPGFFTGGFLSTPPMIIAGKNMPSVKGLPSIYNWMVLDGDNAAILIAAGYASIGVSLVPEHVGTVMGPTADGSYPFSPAEQFAFDAKYDDGSPVTGRIQVGSAAGSPAPHCTDAADETATDVANSTAKYLSNDATYKNQLTCIPMFTHVW